MITRGKTDVLRRQLLAEPFPPEWDGWLSANLAQYSRLSGPERTRLQNNARVIMGEKVWEGCDGLKVTDLMKITVSAQAALLLLGLEHDYFGRVLSIVVFPSAFELPAESREERGERILGQAIDYGSVFVSWEAALSGGRDAAAGHNLVIHEFAHQLDFLDGFTNGAPALRSREQTERWRLAMQGSFQRLRRDLQKGHKTFLGSYAATNPTEFFSVVSEKFFLVPGALRENHPEVFGILAEYYGINPSRWFDGKVDGDSTPASIVNASAAAAGLAAEGTFVDFRCPYCGNLVSYPEGDSGKLRECPNCLECSVVPKRGEMTPRLRLPMQTERLLFARLQSRDAPEVAEILGDAATLRFVEWNVLTPEETEEWIEDQSQIRFPKPDENCSVCFGIKALREGRVIGLARIWFRPDDFGHVHLEIIIHPEWQRHGYGAETLAGLLEFAFSGLRVHRVSTGCDRRNVAGLSLLEKGGLRKESECLRDRFFKGEWVTTIGFALLREEFEVGRSGRGK